MNILWRILHHPPPTGQDVLSSIGDIIIIFGLNYKNLADTQWWKISIFFELLYWKDNLIRCNLDLMDIEKNVGVVFLKWLDALKKKVYDYAKKDIKKIKRPLRVLSASTFRGPRHPLFILKLHKYNQIFSV